MRKLIRLAIILFPFMIFMGTLFANETKNIDVDVKSNTVETPAGESLTDKLPRGQMLYENHCRVCHDSRVHIRDNHKAKSPKDLLYWVNRWSTHLKLNWSNEDKLAVAQHLAQKFYHFNAQP